MKAGSSIALMAVSAALLALSMPVHASKTDSRIVLSARQSYVFNNYLQDDDIRIESRDGAVTLTGIISEDFHKSLAQETVADIPGVKSVDNRLEVKGAAPTANSDAWLRDKVKITLRFHWSVSAGTTEVDVKDGIVTLRGNAATPAQKELTTEYARDVEGVKEVKNEMTMSAAPETTPRMTKEKIDDVSVAALVRMALLLHHSTSALYTTVAAKKGVVTVGGRARTAAEKDLVTKLVKDVNGVKKVKNLMTIEPS
ncbi:MAG: transport-associated protein [Elusimicrobia bacterium GWC2_51_8]|nr:MAG: transport-associated protein [Elusimicrobia bacterium GWA2_51_34]OGR61853.1 MAG: transport-associated protein [Elusimicrobia bacterium GWC2_51_8]HAF94782.1 transport-associated protein [Elusimicrobiota bacterium]HCE99090.1 transport-associated protein [Elusimicrobiota bacterium]